MAYLKAYSTLLFTHLLHKNSASFKLPVAVCVLPLVPDCDIPYFCLGAACCTKRNISTVCSRLNDQYSLTPCHTLHISVALLTLRDRARLRGLVVRFSACLPTRYQQRKSCASTFSDSFGKKSVSYAA